MIKKLLAKQDIYLKSRSSEDLNSLAEDLYGLAYRALRNFESSRQDIFISKERGDAAVNDAVSYLITRYLVDQDFRITSSFYNYLRANIRSNVWNYRLQLLDKFEGVSYSQLSESLPDEFDIEQQFFKKAQRDLFECSLNKIIDQMIICKASGLSEDEKLPYSLIIKRHIEKILKRDREYQSYLYIIRDKQMKSDVIEIMEHTKEWIKDYAKESV